MKLKKTLHNLLALTASSLLAVTSASAQTTVNWNGSTSATWTTADNWDTAPVNDLTTNIANFNLATYGGNPVYAPNAGTTSIAGITIGASNGAMTLSTTNLSIGASGISIASGAGAFTLGTTTLGAAQSWTNNSANLFTFGAVTTGGNRLTIGGSGNSTTASNIAGTGGLTKTGAGTLTLTGSNRAYTGTTIVDSGTLAMATNLITNSSEIQIGNGATLSWTSTATPSFSLASGQNLTGTGATGFLFANNNTAASSIATFGNSTISSSGTLRISRLDIYGTDNVISGGDIQTGGNPNSTINRRGLVVGNGQTTAVTLTGGTVTSLGGSAQADIVGNQSTGNGTLTINGGAYVNTASTGTTSLGFSTSGSGTLTLTSGSATINTLVFNAGTSGSNTSAIVNLDGGTLTLNTLTSTSGTTRQFNFNGGQFEATGNVTFANTLTTNVKDGGAKIDTQGNTVTVSGALVNFGGTSTGGLTKSGSGTLTLSGSNDYTGPTTINGGTLVLTGATQATSAITFTAGSLGLDTGFPVTAASAAVNLDNGTITVTGTTGAASYTLLTAASITSTGTPVLADPAPAGYVLQVIGGDTSDELRLVQTGGASPYDTWSGGASFDGDANGDGVPNGLAFLLGADNPTDNALDLLPVATETAGGLVLTFQMLPPAARGTASLALEYSNTLETGSWTSVAIPDESDTIGDVSFSITDTDLDDDTNPLDVTAAIPASKAVNGKIFARAKATNP